MATCEKCGRYADERRPVKLCDECFAQADPAMRSAPAPAPIARPAGEMRLVGIDVPFWNLVAFFVKVSFAAIPAAIIVALWWGIVGAILTGALHGVR